MLFVIVIVSFFVALFLTYLFCKPSSAFHILDYPNARSLHTTPIPRSGGIAVLTGIIVGGLLLFSFPHHQEIGLTIVSAVLPVAGVSFLEDRYGVHFGLRMLCHLFTAIVLFYMGYEISRVELPGFSWSTPSFLGFLLSTLFVVWMINLYNFMDGMDGFASGMAVIGFTSFAFLGWQSDNILFMGASLIVVGASLGFLIFNFPPAKIFLGDTGSSTLGILVAALSLWAAREKIFPLWVAGLIFSPFIVDATVTLGYRTMTGQKIWLPHKTHFYQKLVQIGWGHRDTLFAEYWLMLACSASALIAMQLSNDAQLILLIAWLLIYGLLMWGIRRITA
jgi:UDP-N-acetylmuramyl pentapeptide phosphotransferase/UDP-N-acetylglucosamine-1-phosphate transferase